jgi:type VI secretion system secreted protein Hcp
MHVRLRRPDAGRLVYTVVPLLIVLVLAGAVAVSRDRPARAAAGQPATAPAAAAAPAAPNALCPDVPDLRGADSGVDGFARIAGIPGDSTDAAHANQIDIVTLTTCVTQTGDSGGGGGGGGTGRPVLDDVVISKHTDRATPLLLSAVATGRHIQDAEITLVRAGQERFTILRIRLQDVVVTRVNSNWLAGSPDEQVALGYASICWDYFPQNRDGSPGAAITACANRNGTAR